MLATLRMGLGLGAPLGPDPAMWGLSATELLQGRPPHAAWAYPCAVAVGSAITGADPWRIGGWLSLVVGAAIGPAVWALARRFGMPSIAALAVAAAAVLLPDVLGFVFQLQPDALTTVAMLGVLAAGLAWEERPTPARAALWAGAALAVVLVREHGPLLFVGVLTALIAARSRWLAAGLVALTIVALASAPLLGWTAWLPSRVALPLAESPLGAGGPLPSYAIEVIGEVGEGFRTSWEHGDVIGVWVALLGRLVARSWENLLLVGLGAVGFGLWGHAGRPGWRAGLVGLSPTLFLLGIWSHRRHTSVLLPIALLGLGLGGLAIVRRRPRAWLPLTALGAIGALLVLRATPFALAAMAGAAEQQRAAMRLADWMGDQPGAWFLGGVHNEVNLYLRWPRHHPDLPRPGTPMPTTWDGTDWRTMWVAPLGSMPPPYTQVHTDGPLAVFRLEPGPGQPRPCGSVVPTSTVLFAPEHMRGTSAPPCSAAPHFYPPPPMPERPWQSIPETPTHRPMPRR